MVAISVIIGVISIATWRRRCCCVEGRANLPIGVIPVFIGIVVLLRVSHDGMGAARSHLSLFLFCGRARGGGEVTRIKSTEQ